MISLDAFLELKLENEKLREELRELQLEHGEEEIREPCAAIRVIYFILSASSSYLDQSPSRPSTSTGVYQPSASGSASEASEASSPSSSTSSSPDYTSVPQQVPSIRPGRPPKNGEARASKKSKKSSSGQATGGRVQQIVAEAGEDGEGMHVCVSCTDCVYRLLGHLEVFWS